MDVTEVSFKRFLNGGMTDAWLTRIAVPLCFCSSARHTIATVVLIIVSTDNTYVRDSRHQISLHLYYTNEVNKVVTCRCKVREFYNRVARQKENEQAVLCNSNRFADILTFIVWIMHT